MNAEELLEEWEPDDEEESTGMRPQRIANIRDDLSRETGMFVPRRIPEIESWLPRMKSQITQKLRQAAGAYDEDEDDESSE